MDIGSVLLFYERIRKIIKPLLFLFSVALRTAKTQTPWSFGYLSAYLIFNFARNFIHFIFDIPNITDKLFSGMKLGNKVGILVNSNVINLLF